MSGEGPVPVQRKSVKKAMKLVQQKMNLVVKLDLRAEFYLTAERAREDGISASDPDVFKREALKYA